MSIQLDAIVKNYGPQRVLNGISFTARKGEVVGFLGPNGAGKSTTMKILTGFLKPSSGAVSVCGIDMITHPIEGQKKIGYLPEHNPLYAEMYVREYLQFHGSIHKIGFEKIEETIAIVGLLPEAHKKIQQLSKGYRQRVGLAAAILHDPEVLILDEPTTGLDPNQLVEIRQLIKALGKDKTVLFSTHIMQEVEAICDRVVIVKKGELVFDKPLEELQLHSKQTIRVTFDYKIEEQFIKRLPHLISFKNPLENNWILVFNASTDMRPVIFDFAQENGLKILGLNRENKNLEVLFQELTT